MASSQEKSTQRSRALLLELLMECQFPTMTREDCPIWEQRQNFSPEKKHEFAMRLSDNEINRILAQHECCYEKRLSDLNRW